MNLLNQDKLKKMKWFFLGLVSLAMGWNGFAQSTVSTPIVGFQKVTVPVGLSTAGFPLLNSDILKAPVSSVSGSAISISGETNIGSKLASGEPYYIEVYSGPLKGDRFDVNTASTISSANGTVTLDSLSSNNTYPTASIATQLDNATVALRKHITIDQIQSMASSSLVGNNTATLADQIQLYDNGTGGYSSFFLRGDGITWRKVGTVTTANKVAVPPGTGVFIAKKTGSVELTSSGGVRQNDFSNPYKVGLQLSAPAYPLDVSPASLGGTATNGWTGNNTATSADQIQVYNTSTGGYDAYFLRGDGATWRKVGTVTTVTSNNVVNAGQAYFVSRKSADNANVLVNPIGN